MINTIKVVVIIIIIVNEYFNNFTMMKIVAYTDGACEKSPRIGGWGWTAITSQINKGKKCVIEWSDHGGLDDTTNQQMELMAMAELLEFCNIGSSIEIWSDSTYTVKGIVGEIIKNPQEQNLKSYLVTLKNRPQGWLNGWKTPRSLINTPYVPYKNDQIGYWNTDRTNGHEWYRIHQRLLLHIEGGSVINFGWVKGHSKIAGNEKADKLADMYKDSKSEKELAKITKKFNEKQLVFNDKRQLETNTSQHIIQKLISGGQIGADRAALEAAHDIGIETGGWIPKGFMTINGPDPLLGSKFALKELKGVENKSITQLYMLRSMKNVDDSDAIIAFRLKLSVGTDKTIGYSLTKKWNVVRDYSIESAYKPCLVITDLEDNENVNKIVEFIVKYNVKVLNVAGHREEVVEGYSDKIKCILTSALKLKPIICNDKISPYYAVAKGRKPGIYRTWAECEAQTTGFKGVKYKKFTTLSDAEQFMIS